MKNGIIIGGTGRSGTTIVVDILKEVSGYLAMYEPRIFIGSIALASVMRRQRSYTQMLDEAEESIALINRSLRLKGDSEGIEKEEYIRLLEEHRSIEDTPEEVVAFYEELFKRLCAKYEKSSWIEKTPHNIKVAKTIIEALKDVKFIHVIRNPVYIYRSVIKKQWGPKNAAEFREWYEEVMIKSIEEYESLDRSRYHIVTLEGLADDAQTKIERLATICGVAEIDKEKIKHAASMIDADKICPVEYMNEMSEEEVEFINSKCGIYYRYWKNRALI